jgi:NADPH:quinone reductase-like Zn-dependent oxidoreductase
VLSWYAPIPPSLDFPGAAALPAAIETATRTLDALGVGAGSTLLVNGASGSVGSTAVQLAVVRGARVIGTASPLAGIGELIESGRFSLPVAQTFPLAQVAEAHRASEDGHVRGKLVLLVG